MDKDVTDFRAARFQWRHTSAARRRGAEMKPRIEASKSECSEDQSMRRQRGRRKRGTRVGGGRAQVSVSEFLRVPSLRRPALITFAAGDLHHTSTQHHGCATLQHVSSRNEVDRSFRLFSSWRRRPRTRSVRRLSPPCARSPSQ